MLPAGSGGRSDPVRLLPGVKKRISVKKRAALGCQGKDRGAARGAAVGEREPAEQHTPGPSGPGGVGPAGASPRHGPREERPNFSFNL